MNGNNDPSISKIIAKKATGEISENEQALLDRWLAESEYNREAYQRLISGRGAMERERFRESINAEKFIQEVNKKLQKRNLRVRLLRYVSAAAAVAGVTAGIYFGYFNGGRTDSDIHDEQRHHIILSLDDGSSYELMPTAEESEWRQVLANTAGAATDDLSADKVLNLKIEVPRGTNYKLRLADGTTVWLNAESEIEYPNVFTGDERNIRITGEAYLQVAHDGKHPFVVTTGDDVKIKVLGTTFSVNCYGDSPVMSVTLESGSVSVTRNDDSVVLKPDQQAVFERGSRAFQVKRVNAEAYSAWTRGIFDFSDVPLSEIMEVMARWYDIGYVYDNVDLSEFGLFTLNVERGADFAQVEEIMEKITGLRFEIRAKTVYVSRK